MQQNSGDLGGVVDLTGRKVGGTEAADGIADVDACRGDDGEQRQQEDGPLAAELVAEAVGAAQLGVMDVAEEEEQPLQHGDDQRPVLTLTTSSSSSSSTTTKITA